MRVGVVTGIPFRTVCSDFAIGERCTQPNRLDLGSVTSGGPS